MLKEFWQRACLRAIERITQFGQDVGNVFQALGAWGVVFLLVEIVLGLLPLACTFTLGRTVDAMIGARGIGVVTSDVNHELMRWLMILLIGFLAYLFSIRFTGKAGEVGRGLRDLVAFTSLLIYLITINQIGLSLLFLIVLVVDSSLAQKLKVRVAGLLVAILAGSASAHHLIRFTVARAFTVGEGLAMIAAIVMVIVFMKMRIASTR